MANVAAEHGAWLAADSRLPPPPDGEGIGEISFASPHSQASSPGGQRLNKVEPKYNFHEESHRRVEARNFSLSLVSARAAGPSVLRRRTTACRTPGCRRAGSTLPEQRSALARPARLPAAAGLAGQRTGGVDFSRPPAVAPHARWAVAR